MRLIVTLITLLMTACQTNNQNTGEQIRFYTGTTDGSLANPIILCELDISTGALAILDSFAGTRGPSYLALSPDRKYLYATDGTFADPEQKTSQQVAAFRVDPETGALKLLNKQPSEGKGSCHISVHPSGKYVFTANYSSGNIVVHPVNADGSLAGPSDVVRHTGSGPDKSRQEAPHAHFISTDPGGNFVLAVDLGIDKVMNYLFDAETGTLSPNPAQEFFGTIPGAGPRHLAFHPDGDKLFLLNELNGTLTACRYDPENGVITELNTLSNLEEGFEGYNKSAAVRVHPVLDVVYASNRGDRNSIAVFTIAEDGSISRIQVQDHRINWPRDFNIDPSGKYLLAENKNGNNIVVFSVDPGTGMLEATGNELKTSQPTCIVFLDE